jgi:hypothetical protein
MDRGWGALRLRVLFSRIQVYVCLDQEAACRETGRQQVSLFILRRLGACKYSKFIAFQQPSLERRQGQNRVLVLHTVPCVIRVLKV